MEIAANGLKKSSQKSLDKFIKFENALCSFFPLRIFKAKREYDVSLQVPEIIIPKDESKVEKLEKDQSEEDSPNRLINKFASAIVTVAGGIKFSYFLYRRFKS